MARIPRSALALAFLICTPLAASAHDHWINHGGYKSPVDGTLCCGDNDCFLVPEENVVTTPEGYRLTSGEVIPFKEALPSEDGQYWRCKRWDGTRRCFFAPRGEF